MKQCKDAIITMSRTITLLNVICTGWNFMAIRTDSDADEIST